VNLNFYREVYPRPRNRVTSNSGARPYVVILPIRFHEPRWYTWGWVENLSDAMGSGPSPVINPSFPVRRNRHFDPKRHSNFAMNYLLYLLIVVHVIISLFLIGVVLLQTGKSADLAGAFGGQGSQTAFGPRGAANLLTKLTSYAAVLFMVTAISLTIVLSHTTNSDRSVLSNAAAGQTTPAKK